MMFGKLKDMFGGDKSGEKVGAPLKGRVVPVAEVNDPTFSEELLGKGVAIRPEGDRVLAPVDGSVALMFETGHAISLLSDGGAEILIHVGLDTVKLKGKHFTVKAKTGDKVKKGDLLIEFDRAAIAAEGYDTITPIVVTNSDDFKSIEPRTGIEAGELDEILALHK